MDKNYVEGRAYGNITKLDDERFDGRGYPCGLYGEKNLGKMYNPIIGEYVLRHWDEVLKCIIK